MNNLKSILRNSRKNKGTTSLNLLGLTAGFMCSIFLISWVIHESTYDSFVPNKESIFRVNLKGIINNEPVRSAGCFPGVAAEAEKSIPEVKQAIRISMNFNKGEDLIKTDDNKFFRVKGLIADEGFFNFFPFPAINGQLDKVLTIKNNIVIVKSLAEKCFGRESAIGKNLKVRGQNYTVAAVLDNIPTNSHLQFQYVIPLLSLDQSWHDNQWGGDNSIIYLKVNPNSDIKSISSKITSIVLDHIPEMKNFNIGFVLEPLTSIPFDSGFKWDNAKKTSKRNIYVLSIVALLIMFIACVNFTNLFISSAIKRNKEVGVKISNGASKFAIVKEYLEEVVLYVLLSFVISLILVKIFHPFFNQLSGANIEINYFDIRFFIVAIPLVAGTILLAGLFPGMYLSRINLSEILKGIKTGSSRMTIQKVLVTAQFVIASVLILAMVTIYKQVDFLQSKELGFDKENILYTYTEGKLINWDQQKKLKDELLRNPLIKSIAYRGALSTEWSNGSTVGKDKGEYTSNFEWIPVDKDYFELSNIRFVEGDNAFAYASDSSNYCIINEKAVEVLGLKPPVVGQTLYSYSGNQQFIIKGVTENVNTKALTQNVDPCIYSKPLWKSESGIMMFKLTGDRSKAIGAIREYYGQNMPDQPFEYHFLDETYNALYKSEEKARSIISWFTAIALILTSLGLLAMVHFITETRTKEIGIRKVNGAKVSEILAMLNKDFIKWVVIAFVIATPIAYYAMQKWLEHFAYKTNLSWWIFALAGLLALGIALLTVSWQSWKIATRNPVEALRYE